MSAIDRVRFFPALCVAALLLVACGEADRPAPPREIAKDTVCVLDGMLLADFPGPKAQIHYAAGEPDFFCDTKEMFAIFLRPEQQRRIVAIYTQDMAKADWTDPEGNWIDAKSAFYVAGSKLKGSMGPTLAAFAGEPDAQSFAKQHGGKVLRFDQVTLDLVDLSGGVVRDPKM